MIPIGVLIEESVDQLKEEGVGKKGGFGIGSDEKAEIEGRDEGEDGEGSVGEAGNLDHADSAVIVDEAAEAVGDELSVWEKSVSRCAGTDELFNGGHCLWGKDF